MLYLIVEYNIIKYNTHLALGVRLTMHYHSTYYVVTEETAKCAAGVDVCMCVCILLLILILIL